tara:strand:+ start:6654 stop:7382 length:729 start_codon:yes stop_codon:yes gene_type:complete
VIKNQTKKSVPSFYLLLIVILTTSLLIKTFQKIDSSNIILSGTNNFSKQDILIHSSLKLPERLIFIKTKLIERELLEKFSLKNISIDRQLFPFGLKISIQTRQPLAYAERKNDGIVNNGYTDIDGYFIPLEFAEIGKEKYTIKIIGWDKDFQNQISKILKFYYQNDNNLESIKISQEGFIELREKKLNKIILGYRPNIIKIKKQLNIIKEMKIQLDDNEILKNLDIVNLTDPAYPEIKVFKP